MLKFITLFNETYLTRGLALYESLRETVGDRFELGILAMSPQTRDVLGQLGLKQVQVIDLDTFETDDLRQVKPQRSLAEYCWTCTPHLIHYALTKLNWEDVFYLDADLFFYQNPTSVIQAWRHSENSIFLTEHWYTPAYDQTRKSGRFCVQFLGFKKDPTGLQALQWWGQQCLNWCYARHEDGRFGDQKYLDDWPQRFSGVQINWERSLGVAPWNIQQYQLDDDFRVRHRRTGYEGPLYFYHFHGLGWDHDGRIFAGSYRLGEKIKNTLYRPYLGRLYWWEKQLVHHARDPSKLRNYLPPKPLWRGWASSLWHRARGTYNVFREVSP